MPHQRVSFHTMSLLISITNLLPSHCRPQPLPRSSLISLVLFAPLFMASGAFLAAEIAAVMGVIASVVALCERELASSNSECVKCGLVGCCH